MIGDGRVEVDQQVDQCRHHLPNADNRLGGQRTIEGQDGPVGVVVELVGEGNEHGVVGHGYEPRFGPALNLVGTSAHQVSRHLGRQVTVLRFGLRSSANHRVGGDETGRCDAGRDQARARR